MNQIETTTFPFITSLFLLLLDAETQFDGICQVTAATQTEKLSINRELKN